MRKVLQIIVVIILITLFFLALRPNKKIYFEDLSTEVRDLLLTLQGYIVIEDSTDFANLCDQTNALGIVTESFSYKIKDTLAVGITLQFIPGAKITGGGYDQRIQILADIDAGNQQIFDNSAIDSSFAIYQTINCAWFGAKTNTDSYVAIQNAFNAIARGSWGDYSFSESMHNQGGSVYLPRGSYYSSGNINFITLNGGAIEFFGDGEFTTVNVASSWYNYYGSAQERTHLAFISPADSGLIMKVIPTASMKPSIRNIAFKDMTDDSTMASLLYFVGSNNNLSVTNCAFLGPWNDIDDGRSACIVLDGSWSTHGFVQVNIEKCNFHKYIRAIRAKGHVSSVWITGNRFTGRTGTAPAYSALTCDHGWTMTRNIFEQHDTIAVAYRSEQNYINNTTDTSSDILLKLIDADSPESNDWISPPSSIWGSPKRGGGNITSIFNDWGFIKHRSIIDCTSVTEKRGYDGSGDWWMYNNIGATEKYDYDYIHNSRSWLFETKGQGLVLGKQDALNPSTSAYFANTLGSTTSSYGNLWNINLMDTTLIRGNLWIHGDRINLHTKDMGGRRDIGVIEFPPHSTYYGIDTLFIYTMRDYRIINKRTTFKDSGDYRSKPMVIGAKSLEIYDDITPRLNWRGVRMGARTALFENDMATLTALKVGDGMTRIDSLAFDSDSGYVRFGDIWKSFPLNNSNGP